MASIRERVEALSARQDHVVTTRQALKIGAGRDWVEHQVRAGRWQRLHRGVLVTHSGPVSWRTRARAGLLYAGPGAALSGSAAGFVHEFVPRPPQIIDVTVPRDRYVLPSSGLRIPRMDRPLDKRSGLVLVERGETVLDLVAEARTEDAAVALLCDAVRAGVSVFVLRSAWQRRTRQPRRALVGELIAEVDAGVESALERRYLRDVERRHGLPRSVMQQRHVVSGQWIRADGVYAGLGVRRELDGELAHPGGRTDKDVWRDNAVQIETGEITLRYRWYHVAGVPCRTAQQVAAALRSRGWRDAPRPCGPSCPVR